MSNEIIIPDFLKGKVSNAADLISTSAGVPINRISLKGSKFRIIENKEETRVVKNELFVTILGVSPPGAIYTKTYYKDAFTGNTAPEAPDCSSSDGVRPDSWVKNPIASKCSECPYNAWNSAGNGSKGKRCKDSKRLYVTLSEDTEGKMYLINISTSSLKALSNYGRDLIAKGAPMEAAVTRLTFDDEVDYPALKFDFVAFLEEKTALASIERAAKKEWDSYSQLALANDSTPKLTNNPHADDDDVVEFIAAKSAKVTKDDSLDQWD